MGKQRVSSSLKLSPADKVVRDFVMEEYGLSSMADSIRLAWVCLAIRRMPTKIMPGKAISAATIDSVMSLLQDDIHHKQAK
jgi:hypothetical protein